MNLAALNEQRQFYQVGLFTITVRIKKAFLYMKTN